MPSYFDNKPLTVLVSLKFVRKPPSLPYCTVQRASHTERPSLTCRRMERHRSAFRPCPNLLHSSCMNRHFANRARGNVPCARNTTVFSYITDAPQTGKVGWAAAVHCSLSARFMEGTHSSFSYTLMIQDTEDSMTLLIPASH